MLVFDIKSGHYSHVAMHGFKLCELLGGQCFTISCIPHTHSNSSFYAFLLTKFSSFLPFSFHLVFYSPLSTFSLLLYYSPLSIFLPLSFILPFLHFFQKQYFRITYSTCKCHILDGLLSLFYSPLPSFSAPFFYSSFSLPLSFILPFLHSLWLFFSYVTSTSSYFFLLYRTLSFLNPSHNSLM